MLQSSPTGLGLMQMNMFAFSTSLWHASQKLVQPAIDTSYAEALPTYISLTRCCETAGQLLVLPLTLLASPKRTLWWLSRTRQTAVPLSKRKCDNTFRRYQLLLCCLVAAKCLMLADLRLK